jgi:hypothetical protein
MGYGVATHFDFDDGLQRVTLLVHATGDREDEVEQLSRREAYSQFSFLLSTRSFIHSFVPFKSS